MERRALGMVARREQKGTDIGTSWTAGLRAKKISLAVADGAKRMLSIAQNWEDYDG
jgi:hypothetical protein